MAQPTDSFKQFDYALRPSKQVERKIMIDVLLSLARAKYDIRQYTYLGFGSPFYVDFVMFHKYLFIKDMICVEWGDIEKRMKFNKPFNFIKLKLQPFSTYIPNIRRSREHFVWVDYDRSLDPEMLNDIHGVLTRTVSSSIFVITIDARPRLPKDVVDLEEKTREERELLTVEKYQEWFQPYIAKPIKRETVSRVQVSDLFYEVVMERIRLTLATRDNRLHFIQLFNYIYQDGAPMITIGGMIGTKADRQVLADAGIFGHPFVQTDPEFLRISVPPLTMREKYWLDSHLNERLIASRLAFELDEQLFENYRKFYKEYPSYMETFL